MAIIAVLADPNDGGLEASAWKNEGSVLNANPDFEEDARRGEGAIIEGSNAPETGQRLKIGGQKWNSGAQTIRYESFVQFTPGAGFVVPPAGGLQEVVSAALRVSRKSISYNSPNDTGFGAKDSMGIWNHDWSGQLSGSDWFDLMAISGQGTGTNYQPEAELSAWMLDKTSAGVLYEGGGEAFWTKVRDHLAAQSAIGYVLLTWTSTQVYPGDHQWIVNLVAANDVLTAPKFHPQLITRTQRQHALNSVGGASIQMTDGTAVFLRYDSATKRYNLYYQRVNQTSPTLIDYLRGKVGATDNSEGSSQFFGYEPGFQSYGLTRDESNNLYIVGPRGNPQTGTYGQKVANSCAYRYDGNYSWSRFTQTIIGDNSLSDTDTHRGFINNCVPVWIPGGAFPSGRLAVVHSRRDGQWGRYQTGVYVHNSGWNLGVAGVARGNNINYAGDDSVVSGFWRPYNSSGSNLDAFRDGETVRIAAGIQAFNNDDTERSGALTSAIGSNNSVGKPATVSASVAAGPHDPDAKIRAVWLGEGSPYWGIARYGHIMVLRKSDGAIHRQIDFPSSNVAGFPSRSVLQKSQAWDVVWDTNDPNWVWMYFRNSTNPRLINKVRWNFTTGQIDAPFQLTPSPLGSSGSEIVALRVPRQQVDARCVLVDVAMQDGAGDPTALLTVRDTTMNKAPAAPTVVGPISSFNASGTKIVEWNFLDNNASDFATFQDVEVKNVATGAISHSASHVTAVAASSGAKRYRYTIPASALTNDAKYEIRFRAYDSVDFPSDWSAATQFSTTTTGGFVLITDPAEDNAPLNRSSVVVRWAYSNTNPSVTQTGYRVRAFNHETGVSVYDSNLITSTATEHEIPGLTSDIEYRVEVTILDSAAQTSGAGMRLVTPDFNNPSLPAIVALSLPGCVEIRVTNPPPTGDNPVTIKNQIARREADEPDSAYVVIGECPPDGVYQDWTVASGVEYTYKARGSSE